MRIEGWRVTWLAFSGLLIITAIIFAVQGNTENAIRGYIRFTARISLLFFLLAFSASSLYFFSRNKGFAWLSGNRRYLGFSFAISHTFHLFAILLLLIEFPHPFLDRLGIISLVGGILAYIFILTMSITSFETPKKLLGQRLWKILHTVGSYYLWIIFAQSYIPKAMKDNFYLPFAMLLLTALCLRIICKIGKRSYLQAN